MISNKLSNIKNILKVPTLKFDKKWTEYIFDNKNEFYPKKEISYISYNVWFETHNWTNRLLSLISLFELYSPDVICLQEVTMEFLLFLQQKEFIKNNYYMSGNFKGSYDVLILTKFPSEFYVRPFPSNMGRNLLFAEIKTDFNENILIGTSHYESLNNASKRKQQFELTFEILNNSDFSFLMGDFNFDPSWENEQKNLDISYKDSFIVYNELNNLTEYGYTMPGTNQFPPWRPDRILFRKGNENKIINLEFFEIIGRDQIEINLQESYCEVKTPSDHYGLYAKFTLN